MRVKNGEIVVDGERYLLGALSRETGVPEHVLRQRVWRGATLDQVRAPYYPRACTARNLEFGLKGVKFERGIYGRILMPEPPARAPAPSDRPRVLARVDSSRGPVACWPWRGAIDPAGYGAVKVSGRRCVAARVVYELLVAPLPHGMRLWSMCGNRWCVNPAHHEVVSATEAMGRARSKNY